MVSFLGCSFVGAPNVFGCNKRCSFKAIYCFKNFSTAFTFHALNIYIWLYFCVRKEKIYINNWQTSMHRHSLESNQKKKREDYAGWIYLSFRYRIDDKFMMSWSNNKYLKAHSSKPQKRRSHQQKKISSQERSFPFATLWIEPKMYLQQQTTRIQMKNCSRRKNSTNKCFEK